jgi:uncharacterized membrane protein
MNETKDAKGTGGGILRFLRLQPQGRAKRTLVGIIIGVAAYLLLYQLVLPSYKLMSLITVQFNLAILAIPVVAAFCGPLAGFLVGVLGSAGADALLTQQFIALGLVNISYGLLGFIAGLPSYDRGFSSGRTLGKLVMFTIAGLFLMAVVYLTALIVVAGQNFLPSLLYNFLPFISVSFITLFLMTPISVRIIDILASNIRKRAQ